MRIAERSRPLLFPSGEPLQFVWAPQRVFAAAGAKSAPSAAPGGSVTARRRHIKQEKGRVSGSRRSNPGEGGNSGIPPLPFSLRRWQGANTPLRPGEEEGRGAPGIGRRRIRRCGASGDFRSACSLPRENIFARSPFHPQQKSFRVSLRTCGHGMGYFAPLHSFVRKLLCAAKGSFLPPSLPPPTRAVGWTSP